jgi:hypothetical protein
MGFLSVTLGPLPYILYTQNAFPTPDLGYNLDYSVILFENLLS